MAPAADIPFVHTRVRVRSWPRSIPAATPAPPGTTARNPAEPHLPAWKQFNTVVRGSGDVAIWHETYRVDPGNCEAIHSNMPRVGLALHGHHRPIGSTSQTAPMRIGALEADEPPVAPY